MIRCNLYENLLGRSLHHRLHTAVFLLCAMSEYCLMHLRNISRCCFHTHLQRTFITAPCANLDTSFKHRAFSMLHTSCLRHIGILIQADQPMKYQRLDTRHAPDPEYLSGVFAYLST
jgi:hypothetical protein